MLYENPYENGAPLLLPSLRLFIPPLRLVSAAMWQVVQQGQVQDYGMLEEFVTTVTEIVPELLSCSQRAKLILGFRARLVIELCRTEQTSNVQNIQQHLDKIRSLASTADSGPSNADVGLCESKFVELVESLLKDPSEREHFYQDVFPVEFSPRYDIAIQMLMLDFLTRLEKLLPIPDLEQTASLLNAVPSALEQCVQSVPDPRQLRTLLQYHRKLGHVESVGGAASSIGDCILSSLSLPPHVQVVTGPNTESATQSEEMDLDGMKPRESEMESAFGEIENEAVSSLNSLEPSHSKTLKQSKISSTVLNPRKISPYRGAVKQPVSSKVLSSQKKSCKRQGPFSKTCEVCGKSFTRVAAMRRHQLTHTGDLKFKCLSCEKCFRDSHDLKRHQRRVCERELQIWDNGKYAEIQPPSTCESPVASPINIPPPPGPSQQGSLDTITSNNTCSVCGRFFARTSSLVRHMSSHSKERPFKCVNCDKRFKYSYDLKKHQNELCKKMTQVDLSQDGGQNVSELNRCPQPEVFLGTAENETQVDSRTCHVCGKILTFASQMERHLKSHSRARPYNCATCERSFKYKDSLKKHQEILGHEGILENTESCSSPPTTVGNFPEASTTDGDTGDAPKTHTCTVCGKVLDCAGHLATHMRSHSEERPYQCLHCDQRFKYMQSLNQHQKYICKMNRVKSSQMEARRRQESDHPVAAEANAPQTSTIELDTCNLKQHRESVDKDEKLKLVLKCEARKVVFKCGDCGKDFKCSSSLRTHKRIHSPFYCSDCGRVLPNSIAFERHKLVQHKEIQCTMCEKTFTLLGRLRDHYLHQHKFTGPYPCSQCERTFTQLSYLVVHERVHSGEYPYQCSVCQANFNSSNSLTIHSRKHTGEKPFLCWQCGKSFRAAGELSVHMGTHSEERLFSCSQCDMSYRTKLQLNSHIEQVHEEVRYPCTICGKQFYKSVSLKRHKLTHTGERPWPCSYCTKTFITANERRLHERYHTGERPYKCQDCGKSFIQSGYLKSHRSLHTGEKPFACSICDKRFRLSYHRVKHERTHTKQNKLHVCGECGLAFAQRKCLTEHRSTHS
uniref:C2H2-type domain-containing protein n=1 Tax=Esox lucius TaxID=8010 RepID=A0AAY5KVF6_ESOLU